MTHPRIEPLTEEVDDLRRAIAVQPVNAVEGLAHREEPTVHPVGQDPKDAVPPRETRLGKRFGIDGSFARDIARPRNATRSGRCAKVFASRALWPRPHVQFMQTVPAPRFYTCWAPLTSISVPEM